MQITKIDPDAVLAAAEALPKDGPVVMLNLIRYNEQAQYGDRPNEAPCSGQEAYLQRYAPAFSQIAAAEGVSGVEVLYLGSVAASLAALPDEHWDNIVLVKYPSFAAFQAITESPRYEAEAAPHRRAALADWRLFATAPLSLPD